MPHESSAKGEFQFGTWDTNKNTASTMAAPTATTTGTITGSIDNGDQQNLPASVNDNLAYAFGSAQPIFRFFILVYV